MSDLWFNIRFGARHLQIGPNKISWAINDYHIENKPKKWFAVYCWFGTHYN